MSALHLNGKRQPFDRKWLVVSFLFSYDSYVVFHYACNLNQLSPNVPWTTEVDDRFVILTLIDGEVFCIEDLCTHDGGALGDGEVNENCIACPRHGAKFDLRTGNALTMPATEPSPTHETKIEDGKVYVKID